MTRYRLEGFENADGLGDVSLGVLFLDAPDRHAAGMLATAHFTGNPVGAPLRRRMWIMIDETWQGITVTTIEHQILCALSDPSLSGGALAVDSLYGATQLLRGTTHLRDGLRTLLAKGLVEQPEPEHYRLTQEPA